MVLFLISNNHPFSSTAYFSKRHLQSVVPSKDKIKT